MQSQLVLVISVLLTIQEICAFHNMFNLILENSKSKVNKTNDCWMDQKLNHFDPIDSRMWKMRYRSKNELYKIGGPIFIFVGGEWNIDKDFENIFESGQMFDLAKKHNAAMFYTQHRFYDKSFPNENSTIEFFKYLSIDQALEDLAYFIDHVKSTNAELKTSKVVLFGGSYSAMLASYARVKFPHLIDAVYASSPVFPVVMGIPKYYEVVDQQINLVSHTCFQIYFDGFTEIREHLNSTSGIDFVSKVLNTCTKINPLQPYVGYFFSALSLLMPNVQNKGRKDIVEVCDQLMQQNGSSLEKIATFASKKLEGNCLNVPIKEPFFPNSWLYQLCTEFGLYETTTPEGQILGNEIPLDVFYTTCYNTFGSSFTPDIINKGMAHTKRTFGSLNVKLENVVIYNGGVDPWHFNVPMKNVSDSAPVFFVENMHHCADLSVDDEDVTEELKTVKEHMKNIISKWIE